MKDRAGIVQLFLERGDVYADHGDEKGMTPLAIAVNYASIEAVKPLLEREGVDVNAKNNNGHTVLELAKKAEWRTHLEHKRYRT